MRIIYNGIDLMVQETVRYDMEAVYDDSGTDYLYTRHLFVGRALVNGQADVFNGRFIDGQFVRNGPFMTYEKQGGSDLRAGGQDNPTGARNLVTDDMLIPRPVWNAQNIGNLPAGKSSGVDKAPQSLLAMVVPKPVSPVTTVASIRHRLMTPRGKLTIMDGGWGVTPDSPFQGPYQILVQSPFDGYITDCKNGPSPRVLSIVQALGDATTLVVEFAVETFVNESAYNNVGNPGGLLSNRYSQQHIIGDDYLTTVRTEGQAIFRTDTLYKFMESPDSRRPILMLPIPNGFIRGNIMVQGLPDVTGVVYSFEDHQVPVNFPAAPYVKAAKIAAVHRQALIAGGNVLEGALATYERVLGTMANRRFATQRDEDDDPTPTGRPRKLRLFRPAEPPEAP